MKKLLIITFLLTFGISFGQEKEEKLIIQKGTWNIGGDLSFGKSNFERNDLNESTNDYSNFSFYPKVGYFISDNFIIGLGLGYSYQNNENNYNNIFQNNISNSLSIYPFIRKYYSLGNKFSLFLQGEIKYSKSWVKNNQESYNTYSSNNYFIGIRPGVNYFLNKNFALEANIGSLGYSKSKIGGSRAVEVKEDSFSLSLNSSSIFFGLSYYF